MKAVLISINPPNTDNIFDGVKRIEWRTKPLPTGRFFCYETKNIGGAGKVIGEFTVWRTKRYERAGLIHETEINLGCVPKDFLLHYSKGKPIYANYIVKPKRYEQPRELNEFFHACEKPNGTDCSVCVDRRENKCKPVKRAPQSWFYVEEVRQ